MPGIDVLFSRALLAQALPLIRAAGKRVNKDAWVWRFRRDHWEFHGPDDFVWHGSADNAYDARYKGWMAWLRSKGVEV